MNELSSNFIPYTWLKKRAEMYSNIAESGFYPLNKVGFHFSDPDCGWICLTISIDGKEVAKAHLSNVLWGDPVAHMLDWAESCISEPSNYCFPFGEGIDYIFHYERMLYLPIQRINKGNLDTGIFSLFIMGYGHKDILFEYALCDTKEFLESFYNAILDFAKRQETNENVVEDWAGENYSDGGEEYIEGEYIVEKYSEEEKERAKKKMLDNMRSPRIEDYVRRRRKNRQL